MKIFKTPSSDVQFCVSPHMSGSEIVRSTGSYILYRNKEFRIRRASDVVLYTITIQLEFSVVDTLGLVAVGVDPTDISLQLEGSF